MSDTRNDGMGMSGLEKASSIPRRNGAIEKGLTVDDDGIESIGLGISGIGRIDSSLHCEERP